MISFSVIGFLVGDGDGDGADVGEGAPRTTVHSPRHTL